MISIFTLRSGFQAEGLGCALGRASRFQYRVRAAKVAQYLRSGQRPHNQSAPKRDGQASLVPRSSGAVTVVCTSTASAVIVAIACHHDAFNIHYGLHSRLPGNATSARVDRSRSDRNAAPARCNRLFSRQHPVMVQASPSTAKHATKACPSSNTRTMSPSRICSAGRASIAPPPAPRRVVTMPAWARAAMILVR